LFHKKLKETGLAKIVYGVSGEGSGHSSRAREMLDHLLHLGHVLKVVSYDRGYRNLKNDFDVFETEGLHIASSDNRVSKVKTFTDNLQRRPRGHKRLKVLKSFPREKFLVYGYERHKQDGNLIFKPFSREGFLADFASCKAVMATAGFTLMTEAFYLRKPYLALPMRGQFEQELNAHWLAKLNYGINLRRVRSEAMGNFLYRVSDFKKNLNDYRAVDNSAIKDKLEELLGDNCALAREYHRRRRAS
jgi:UDP:flavonoid glycosyltransferase YjiC (YdhE family)